MAGWEGLRGRSLSARKTCLGSWSVSEWQGKRQAFWAREAGRLAALFWERFRKDLGAWLLYSSICSVRLPVNWLSFPEGWSLVRWLTDPAGRNGLLFGADQNVTSPLKVSTRAQILFFGPGGSSFFLMGLSTTLITTYFHSVLSPKEGATVILPFPGKWDLGSKIDHKGGVHPRWPPIPAILCCLMLQYCVFLSILESLIYHNVLTNSCWLTYSETYASVILLVTET